MATLTPTLTFLQEYESSGNVNTSGAVAVGTTVEVGKVIVIGASMGGNGIDATVADSKGNTWTPVGSAAGTASSPAHSMHMYYCVVSTQLGPTDTITVNRLSGGNPSNGGLCWLAAVVSNVSGAVDSSGGNSGTTAGVTGTATAALENHLTIMYLSSRDGLTISSVNNGFTGVGLVSSTGSGNPRGGHMSYRVSPGTETITPSVTMGVAASWLTKTIELIPAEDAVEPPVNPLTVVEWDGTNGIELAIIEYDGVTTIPLGFYAEVGAGFGYTAFGTSPFGD